MVSRDELRTALNWTTVYVLAVAVGLWFRHDLEMIGDYWWYAIVYFVVSLLLRKV